MRASASNSLSALSYARGLGIWLTVVHTQARARLAPQISKLTLHWAGWDLARSRVFSQGIWGSHARAGSVGRWPWRSLTLYLTMSAPT